MREDAYNASSIYDSVAAARARGYGEAIIYTSPRELFNDLSRGKIAAALRGNLPANILLRQLKKKFSLERTLRAALLSVPRPIADQYFFLAPVGIDEGSTPDEKLDIILKSRELLALLGFRAKIGVLSAGRFEDVSRSERIKRSLEEGEKIVHAAQAEGISAVHYGIQIEEALKNSNLIIAPDGVSGNLIFRTLHYLGGGSALGAPELNLLAKGKIYIDTSRDKKDYTGAIALGSALAMP